MSRLLDVARDLAGRGYFVFACRPVGKEPIVRGGVHAATRDEREILHMWDREPAANVAISDGASGIMVLDIDPKHGADPAEVLERLGLDLRQWAHVLTGEAPEPDEQFPDSLSGVRGVHVPFKAPGIDSVPRTTIVGVELRARGLYTIAPGSRHPSGVEYEGELPPVTRLPGPPPSVLALHADGSARFGSGSLPTVVDGEPITELRPPTLLRWAIDNVYAAGLYGNPALERMLAENAARVVPPLPPREVKRLWRWADRSRVAKSSRWLDHHPVVKAAASRIAARERRGLDARNEMD